MFKNSFADLLMEKYKSHWHPHTPHRGSAFRSITIDHNCVDPLITRAMKKVPLGSSSMERVLLKLPKELSMWVDPAEVSYRFGDHGSVGVLYSQSSEEDTTSDYESDVSSVSSSPCSSPPRSPYDYRQQSTHSIHHQPTQCRREVLLSSPFPNPYYYNRMETSVA